MVIYLMTGLEYQFVVHLTTSFYLFFPCVQAVEKEGAVVEALRARRLVILDNIRDNDEAGFNYQKVLTYRISIVQWIALSAFDHFVAVFLYRKLKQMRSNDASSKI